MGGGVGLLGGVVICLLVNHTIELQHTFDVFLPLVVDHTCIHDRKPMVTISYSKVRRYVLQISKL